MRVLHVVNHFDDAGNGIVNVTVDLACGLSSRGHRVAVASSPGTYVPLVRQWGVEHFPLDTSPQPWRSRAALFRWRRIVAGFRPDLVHVHTPLAALVAVSSRGYRTVATVHNSFRRSSSLMARADCVVAVSEGVAEDLARRRWFGRRPRVVLNGVWGSPRQRERPGPTPELGQPAVVSVGAISARKGTDVLLRAWPAVLHEHPAAQLYLVGNNDGDPYRPLVQDLGIEEHVHLTGFSPVPGAYLAAARLVVQPSRRDPFPLALLEAKAAGRAIIGSRVDGIPQALDFGRSGVLVDPDDVPALARSICALLGNDAERARWEELSRQSSAPYGVDRMVSDYEALYRELLAVPVAGTP